MYVTVAVDKLDQLLVVGIIYFVIIFSLSKNKQEEILFVTEFYFSSFFYQYKLNNSIELISFENFINK